MGVICSGGYPNRLNSRNNMPNKKEPHLRNKKTTPESNLHIKRRFAYQPIKISLEQARKMVKMIKADLPY